MGNGTEKHLKSHQYYIDLYDRHTVEECRRTEHIGEEVDVPDSEDKSISAEDKERVKNYVNRLHLNFVKGERYLNKEKIIREWMDADQRRDDLYEFAQPPEDIRCLTCRNRVKPTSKYLWYGSGKEDRVLFMFDCPNQCLPHRAFFSDGEEWRAKPNLCPSCKVALDHKEEDDGKKLVTTYTCSKCGYTNTDEIEWTSKKYEIDENFAKDRDRFCMTEEEGKKYQDEKWGLQQLANLMKEIDEEQKKREERLKENPKGFHLEGAGYTCTICGGHTPEGDNWYDEYGIKCLVCQKAVDEGEIPASLAKDKESWYSKWDLERSFNLKAPTLRSWVKKGVIKPRTITRYGEGIHYQLFLLEDNKDFLPPKKLVESRSVREIKDGKEWFGSEPWYRFVDPIEHLKGYKIVEYMEVTKPGEDKDSDSKV